MGNQAGIMIDPTHRKLEIAYIKNFQLCGPELKADINADIQVMLASVNKSDPAQTIEGGPLEPEIKEILLDRINEYRLSKEIDERFFDPQIMAVINCLYGNLLTVDRELFKAADSTKNYFRLTDNLSAGNWGIVFKARNSGSKMNFIIKTQLNPGLADMSIHEVFAALKAINPLRKYCPNFSVLYGGFICGKPDGISGQLCTGTMDVPYTIYETVPGDTLFKLLTSLQDNNSLYIENSIDSSYAQVLSALLQLYFALKVAHKQAYNFAHRDLHIENIIMRPLNQEMVIKYPSSSMNPIQNVPILNVDYYVRCNQVATIIDYDNCELYLPVNYGPGDNRTERFGKKDRDPPGRPVSGDPNLSHLRDMAKILGFTAYMAMRSHANTKFKILLEDLYIQTIQPALLDKYRVNNPDATVLNTPMKTSDYPELLNRDRATFFQMTHEQVRLSRQGTLHFDNFFEVFTRIVPNNYVKHLLMIDNQPGISSVEKLVGVPILACKAGQCASEVETYRTLINPQDEAPLSSADPLEPENLTYQVEAVTKSRDRMDTVFRKDFQGVKISPQATNRDLTIGYRDVLVAKLTLAEAELTKARAQDMGNKLNNTMLRIRVLLNGFVLPVHQEFNKVNVKPGVGLQKYREVIDKAFKLIAAAREITTINDVLVQINSDVARQYSAEVIKHIETVNAFLSNAFEPWKNELIRLVASNYFGDNSPEISRLILSKL